MSSAVPEKSVNFFFISDGTGYVDDGRELFDDDLEYKPETGQDLLGEAKVCREVLSTLCCLLTVVHSS